MKLTGVPFPESGKSRIAVLREIRGVCGLTLKDAKALFDRVDAGEHVNLPLLPQLDRRHVLNTLLGVGCSVHPEGDAPSREQVAEVNEEALFADGLDAALIGYVDRYGQPPVALYDHAKCIEIFMAEMPCDDAGCEDEDCEHAYLSAVEHFDFNVIGGWQGENTPAFATLLTRDDI